MTPHSGWVKKDSTSKRNEEKLYWKVDHYFYRLSGSGLLQFSDEGFPPYYHRTLGDYLNAMLEVGFLLENVDEPEPPDDLAENCASMTRIAEFLVVSALKPE